VVVEHVAGHLDAPAEAEPIVHALDVRGDGVRAEVEVARDLVVGQAAPTSTACASPLSIRPRLDS
jgi:hypothetical protein